mgnify:CR=1 FL=1
MKKPDAGPHVFTREIAEKYDSYYSTEMGRKVDILEKKAVDELIRNLPKTELLEIGCGTGHWTDHFAARGFSVTATDPSEHMIHGARGRWSRKTFVRTSAESLPFPDGAFPAVAAITVFEFLEDPAAAVREILRVLKPGGFFIGGFLNAASELAKNVDADPVLSRGRLMTEAAVRDLLAPFACRETRTCVHFSPALEILDGSPRASAFPPAFIAVRAEKEV